MGKDMRNTADLDTPYELTSEQIEQFKIQGYIKLKDVLSEATLEVYGKIITDQVRELSTQHLPMEERSLYQQAFLQIGGLWTKSSDIRTFSFGKKLAKIAADLLEVSGVRMYNDQALFKEPGGGYTPWHADQQYWPLATEKSITAWIPLQATPLEMGPLSFAVGSHTSGFAQNLEISARSESAIDEYVQEQQLVCNESGFDLGEVSFHYGWTLHRAGANRTNNMRGVMTVIYIDEKMTLARNLTENQEADRDAFCKRVKPGGLIDSPLNPVLYRR